MVWPKWLVYCRPNHYSVWDFQTGQTEFFNRTRQTSQINPVLLALIIITITYYWLPFSGEFWCSRGETTTVMCASFPSQLTEPTLQVQPCVGWKLWPLELIQKETSTLQSWERLLKQIRTTWLLLWYALSTYFSLWMCNFIEFVNDKLFWI